MDKLPCYEMVINEDTESGVEVSFVALVDKPAIEKNFLAFKDLSLNFAVNDERRIISGPAMVANTLIYRRDENGEYNVFFSKETIQEIALKFFKKDYQKNINLFHDQALALSDVTIFESFISDKSRGIQPMKGFEDLPDGSWFISAKIENDDVWNKIKTGAVKGFSVEGVFSYIKKQNTIEDKIFRLLSETANGNVLLKESEAMSLVKDLIKKAKAAFDGTPLVTPPPAQQSAAPPVATTPPAQAAPPATGFADYTLKDGTAVKCDKLEVGGVVMVGDIPASPGELELSDGTKLTVGDGGVITAVMPGQPAEPPLTMSAVTELINKAFETYKAEMAAERLAASQKLTATETKLAAAEAKITKQSDTIKGIFEIVEKLADMPSADSLEPAKTNFMKQFEVNRDQKNAELAKRLSTLKKVS